MECGGYTASSCGSCPFSHPSAPKVASVPGLAGADGTFNDYCGGECMWMEYKCVNRGGQTCCTEATAKCLACQNGISPAAYCAYYPSTAGCAELCCDKVVAECIACELGVTKEAYCTALPTTPGCSEKPTQVNCGSYHASSCEACPKSHPDPDVPILDGSGSLHEFCSGDCMPMGGKCVNKGGQKCCIDNHAKCYACQRGVTPAEYCKMYPATKGCDEVCCDELVAECIACGANTTVKAVCAEYPTAPSCP